MGTATTNERKFVVRPLGSNTYRYGFAVVVAALVALVAFSPSDRVESTESPAFSRAQQAWADRLTGLAETQTIADLTRSRAAEAARWQAMGDQHRHDRMTRAATDRWSGLADHYGVTELSRAQQAETDRLTGLAEYFDGHR
jgi:hypothetical protein